MRHNKKFNHLGRKSAHRKAMLKNMAISLIEHKRITTTLAKAKALRVFLEPLVTKAKNNTMHSRRVVFSYLQNKEAVKELFGEVATKVANRPGGYLRIFKIGFRKGDNADMAIIEFVDFNETMLSDEGSSKKRRTRRSRRGGGNKQNVAAEVENAVEETVEEANDTIKDVVEDALNDDETKTEE
jgi:large subunit ribosomal protein L17